MSLEFRIAPTSLSDESSFDQWHSKLFQFKIKTKSGVHSETAEFQAEKTGYGNQGKYGLKVTHRWGSKRGIVSYISVGHFHESSAVKWPVRHLNTKLVIQQISGEVMYGVLLRYKNQLFLGPTTVLKNQEKKTVWLKSKLKQEDFNALNRNEAHPLRKPSFQNVSADNPLEIGFATINSTTSKHSKTISRLDEFIACADLDPSMLGIKPDKSTSSSEQKTTNHSVGTTPSTPSKENNHSQSPPQTHSVSIQSCTPQKSKEIQAFLPDRNTNQLKQDKRVLLNKLSVMEDKMSATHEEYQAQIDHLMTTIEELKRPQSIDVAQQTTESSFDKTESDDQENASPTSKIRIMDEYWVDQHKEMQKTLGDWNLI